MYREYKLGKERGIKHMRFSHNQFVLCKQRQRMGSTLLNGLFIQLLLTLTLLVPTSDGQLKQSDKIRIDNGIKLGREILTVLEKGTFPEVLKTLGKNLGPYLGAVGSALSLIFSFIPTKSAELQYLEKLKEYFDIRFDKFDISFKEIERKIDEAVLKNIYVPIELNIRDMTEERIDLLKIPKKGLTNRKKRFVNKYENTYGDSGKKLYNLVVGDKSTFGGNLEPLLRNYTQNDLPKIEVYLRGVLELVIEAILIDMTYFNIKGWKVIAAYETDKWQKRNESLAQKFQEICENVKEAYLEQSLKDTKSIVANNANLSNKELSNLLYKELTRKYYWRDWMVLVYNQVSGWEYHCISTCGGGHFFREHGHNVVIASVDKSEPALDLNRARLTLYEPIEEEWYYRAPTLDDGGYGSGIIMDAKEICNSMDTSFACGKAVIKHLKKGFWNTWDPSNLHANFKDSRAVLVKREYFTMILFK